MIVLSLSLLLFCFVSSNFKRIPNLQQLTFQPIQLSAVGLFKRIHVIKPKLTLSSNIVNSDKMLKKYLIALLLLLSLNAVLMQRYCQRNGRSCAKDSNCCNGKCNPNNQCGTWRIMVELNETKSAEAA